MEGKWQKWNLGENDYSKATNNKQTNKHKKLNKNKKKSELNFSKVKLAKSNYTRK